MNTNATAEQALDVAAMEVRMGLELARQAQSGRSDTDDLAQCSLSYIETHLLNAQAALNALGARSQA